MHKERLDFKQKILVLLVFLAMGCIVVWQARSAYQADISQQKERARLNARIYAEELRSDFEAGKNITDALDDTVVATDGRVNNFDRIAAHEMEAYISSIQLAPDAKVQYIYPLQGNEAGMIDLLADDKRRDVARYSIQNRETVMQGPFALKQGGYGIAIRNPIFTSGEDGENTFWGFAIAIIKVPDIFEGTLNALQEIGYDYSLTATESPLSSKPVTVTSSRKEQEVSLSHPVQASFQAGGCTWTLNVERKGGWKSVRMPMVLLLGVIYQIFATVVIYLLLRTRQQHKELVRKAITDELTGLLSRRGLMEALAKFTANNPDGRMTLAFIDLDDFKQINDLYGHIIGDVALKTLAVNLRTFFPESSIVARNGGDEFCVVILGKSPRECEELIRAAVEKDQSFEYEKKHYRFTISVGYADYPAQAGEMNTLLNHADEALYAAKIAGKHRCMHFSPAMADVKRTQLGFSLKDIANGMPGAFMIYSAAGDEEILFANQDLIRMTGCSDFEEFLDWTKHSFRGFVHPEDLDRVEESIQRQIEEVNGSMTEGSCPGDQKVKLENGDQRADGSASEGSHREDYVEYRIIKKDGGILPVVDIGRLINSENHGEVFFVFIRLKDEFQKNF